MKSSILFMFLSFMLFSGMHVFAEDVQERASSGDVIEIDEGIYQVIESDEQSYTEYRDGDEFAVNESSAGFDNGEVDNSGSGDEQSGQEGDNNTDAGSTETVNESNAESENDEVISKLQVIDSDIITLNETLLKIMISLWVLAGIFIGLKLIKEMFGYG